MARVPNAVEILSKITTARAFIPTNLVNFGLLFQPIKLDHRHIAASACRVLELYTQLIFMAALWNRTGQERVLRGG